MRRRFSALALAAIMSAPWVAACTNPTPKPADPFHRTVDGKPDFNGTWQAMSAAAYNIEDHAAEPGVPGGLGIVQGGDIPYLSDALAKRKANYASRATLDPQVKCYLPGVPRAMYMPFPFQIAQSAMHVVIGFEYAGASRVIYLDGSPHPEGGVEAWMGDSRGHWEGDVLVVDVADLHEATWFDQSGNYHSDALHIVERYSPIDVSHLMYEATIEDPQVFSRPWIVRVPLYRNVDSAAQLVEYRCVEFVEPSLYGPLSKPGATRREMER